MTLRPARTAPRRFGQREFGNAARYGLGPAQVEAIKERQGGRCPVCLRVPRTWVVDHSHRLARRHPHPESVGCPRCVRGLICSSCNSVLGFAADSAETLLRAVAYLRAAGEPG